MLSSFQSKDAVSKRNKPLKAHRSRPAVHLVGERKVSNIASNIMDQFIAKAGDGSLGKLLRANKQQQQKGLSWVVLMLMSSLFLSPLQVSAMPLSWSCLFWTSTTSWSWPGDSTTCSSAFSRSFPGPNASSPGTRRAAWRTRSARTRQCGWQPTSPTLPPLSLSSGSELSHARAPSHEWICTIHTKGTVCFYLIIFAVLFMFCAAS